MAVCRQAASPCQSQRWPRSTSRYRVTRPQWVNVYVEASVFVACYHLERGMLEFDHRNTSTGRWIKHGVYPCVSTRHVCGNWIRSFFSCVQANIYEWLSPSFCSSVRPSRLFHISSWNFQELLPMTEVMSMRRSGWEVKGQGHRNRDPINAFQDRSPSLNSHMATKWCTQFDVV